MKRAAFALGAFALALSAPRAARAQCTARPTDASGSSYVYAPAEVKSFDTGAIRVHYATSGIHAPDLTSTRADGVPDTVAFAATTGDDALRKYAEMGYLAPPSDASCANGEDDKLDVYLVRFGQGGDGTTIKVACNGEKCASFVLVDATFKGRGYANPQQGFGTVVTHELFHTVQNAYAADMEERFWAEGTAQWAMHVLHPELPDFEGQLPAFFSDPHRSIDDLSTSVSSGYQYGSAVWPLFLAIRHGPETIKSVLEAQAKGEKAIPAIDDVLKTKGSSLADEFPLFWAWNAGTKDRTGTGGYPDAAKYPGLAAKDVGVLEDGANAITSGLGAYVFAGDLGGKSKVSLETDETRNRGVLVPLDGDKTRLDAAQPLPATADGRVLVVVAGVTSKKTDAPFTLHVAPDDASASSSSSSGGSSDGGGCGCHAAPRGNDAAGFAAFLALFSVVRARTRLRSHVRPRSRARRLRRRA